MKKTHQNERLTLQKLCVPFLQNVKVWFFSTLLVTGNFITESPFLVYIHLDL